MEGVSPEGYPYWYHTETGGLESIHLVFTHFTITHFAVIASRLLIVYLKLHLSHLSESRWEKPNDLPPTNETPKSSLASSSEKALQKELTSGGNGCHEAQLSQDAEVTKQPTLPSVVPENSFRVRTIEMENIYVPVFKLPHGIFQKRKAEGEPSGKDEDQTSNNIPQEDVKEEKKEKVQNTTSESGVKKQEEVAKAKKPKSLNPYGAWEQIKEEKDP